MLRHMKKWNVREIRNVGRKFYFQGCLDAASHNGEIPHYVYYVRAQYQHFIIGDHDKAKMYYILSIVIKNEGRGLAGNCLMNKEYLIGIRTLNATKKLRGKYFMKMLNNDCCSQKQLFMQIISNLNCDYCGLPNDAARLKCCKSCMNTYYCSKHCQKRHWSVHKYECNRSWQNVYKPLKVCVFDS